MSKVQAEKVQGMSPSRREELIVGNGMSPFFPDAQSVQQLAYANGMLELIVKLNASRAEVAQLKKEITEVPKNGKPPMTAEPTKASVEVSAEKVMLQPTFCEMLLKQANNTANVETIRKGLKNLEKMLRTEGCIVDLAEFLTWLDGVDGKTTKKGVIELWVKESTAIASRAPEVRPTPNQTQVETPQNATSPTALAQAREQGAHGSPQTEHGDVTRNVEQNVDGSAEGETAVQMTRAIGPSFNKGQW